MSDSKNQASDSPQVNPWVYADPEEGYDYIVSMAANMLSYADGQGVQRKIHIPRGRWSEMADHFTHQRWDDLAKFPTWSKSYLVKITLQRFSCI